MTDPDPDTIEIISHGTHCPNWSDPKTLEEWRATEMVLEIVEEDGIAQIGRCPLCGEAIFFYMDGGAIDFGIGSELPSQEGQDLVHIEMFESVVRYDEKYPKGRGAYESSQ